MHSLSALNQTLFQYVHHFAGRNIFLDDFGIFLAQYLPYLMVAAFLLLVIYQDGWRKKLYAFAEGAIAVMLARGLITEVIRYFYHSPRPFGVLGFTPLIPEAGWSFPSGHMAWFFATALVVWYLNRSWGWWFLALLALMGVARIYVGVHWPLDIVAGALVGLASAWFVRWLLKKSREKLYSVTP